MWYGMGEVAEPLRRVARDNVQRERRGDKEGSWGRYKLAVILEVGEGEKEIDEHWRWCTGPADPKYRSVLKK